MISFTRTGHITSIPSKARWRAFKHTFVTTHVQINKLIIRVKETKGRETRGRALKGNY